jgi:hypothetical protein
MRRHVLAETRRPSVDVAFATNQFVLISVRHAFSGVTPQLGNEPARGSRPRLRGAFPLARHGLQGLWTVRWAGFDFGRVGLVTSISAESVRRFRLTHTMALAVIAPNSALFIRSLGWLNGASGLQPLSSQFVVYPCRPSRQNGFAHGKWQGIIGHSHQDPTSTFRRTRCGCYSMRTTSH